MAQEKKQIFQNEQKRVTTFYQEDDEDDDPQFELEVHSLTDVSHDPKPLENKEIKKKPSTWKRIRHFLGIRKPRRWKRLKEPAPSGSSHKDHSQRCEADRPTARPQPRNRELDKLQSLTSPSSDPCSIPGGLEPIPSDIGQEAKSTLIRSQSYRWDNLQRQTNLHTQIHFHPYGQSEFPNTLTPVEENAR